MTPGPPAHLPHENKKRRKLAVINMGRINSFCTLCYVIHHEEIGRWLMAFVLEILLLRSHQLA